MSLVTPSTRLAISTPNSSRTSGSEALVSSTVSCSSAAHSVAVSSRMPAQIFATPTGWMMKSSPDWRRWSAWRSHANANACSTASRSIGSTESPSCSSITASRSRRRPLSNSLSSKLLRDRRRLDGLAAAVPARIVDALALEVPLGDRDGRARALRPAPLRAPFGARLLAAFDRLRGCPGRAVVAGFLATVAAALTDVLGQLGHTSSVALRAEAESGCRPGRMGERAGGQAARARTGTDPLLARRGWAERPKRCTQRGVAVVCTIM